MKKQYVFYVVAVVLGLAGGLSLSAHGAAQTEDARAVVDSIKELTKEVSRLRETVRDAGKDCRK